MEKINKNMISTLLLCFGAGKLFTGKVKSPNSIDAVLDTEYDVVSTPKQNLYTKSTQFDYAKK